MKGIVAWVGLVLLLMSGTTRLVHASCAPPVPPQQNLQQSDAVFSGEVTSVGTTTVLHDFFGWGYPVTFNVLESWKGINTTTVTLKGQNRTSVAFPFEQGQRYLVYAYYEGQASTGSLTTNGCKGTKLLAGAQADLQVLGAGSIALQRVDAAGSSNLLLLMVGSGVAIAGLSIVGVARYRRTKS